MVSHCTGRAGRDSIVEEAIRTLLSTVDMQVVLERSAELLRRHFGATRVSIQRILEGADRGQVEVLVVDGPLVSGATRLERRTLAGSACAEAIRTRGAFAVEGIGQVAPRWREEEELERLGYGAMVCFPLVFEDHVLGTLEIAHRPREGLLPDCRRHAEQIAGLVAIALHNSLMVEEVRRLNRLLDRENARLKDEIREARRDARYVAESPLMREVLSQVRLVAPSDTTVLIRGETGTGKEGLARRVHEWSGRAAGPFVVVNLGAIPEALIESDLFGHEKGAFTGATARKPGRFELAAGGTLFLDEVGDAPTSVQLRLLRALQEREFQRVGGTETLRVDARVVAATNRPLERLVEEGTFRTDLYYRLNIFPLHLPPLRERREDVRPLVEYFLDRQAAAMHRRPPRLSPAALHALEAYAWPGNVRELENFLMRALILCRRDELTLPELPGAPPDAQPAPARAAAADLPRFDEAVKSLLRRTLEATGGRIYGPAGAAARLGIKPTTLQGKLRKHGLARPHRR